MPPVLVMFSLFFPLPCLRGVLEFAVALHEDMEVDKIMRHLLTLWANSNTPPLMLAMFSLFCPLQCLRGVLEFAPSVSNVLIIFVHFHVFVECSSLPLVLVMFPLFCPLPCLRGMLEFVSSVSNVLIILSTSMSSWSARVCL